MNDYMLVRYHNEPNDRYKVRVTCGSKEVCLAYKVKYEGIFDPKTDTFEVERRD